MTTKPQSGWLRRTLVVRALLLLVFAGWILLAPAQLGGRASYVVTEGDSMEPGIRAGTLGVTRAAADYRVGDVVAYRSATLGRVVLHRIVARDGSRFALEGDANGWRDPDHPTADAFVGKLWVHVPAAGKVIAPLQRPEIVALLVGLGTLLALGGSRRRRRRTREGDSPDRAARPLRERVPRTLGAPVVDGVSLLAAGVAAAGILLALAAFTRPLSRVVDRTVSYRQAGVLAYGAPSRGSDVYGARARRRATPSTCASATTSTSPSATPSPPSSRTPSAAPASSSPSSTTTAAGAARSSCAARSASPGTG